MKLPEHKPDHGTPLVLATAKAITLRAYQREYGPQAVIGSADPETKWSHEPSADNPLIPASWKAIRVANMAAMEPSIANGFIVLATDVVFKNQHNQVLHKPKRSDFDQEQLIEEAQSWYCADSFVVQWLLAQVVEERRPSLRRSTGVLYTVTGTFPALDRTMVEEQFSPDINARLPLIELAQAGVPAHFAIQYQETISRATSEALQVDDAYRLLVEKVIPPQAMLHLLQAGPNQMGSVVSLLGGSRG